MGAHIVRETEPHYEISAGVRHPTRLSGKVRGVVYENVPGGGLELWYCDHDHAPGIRNMRRISDGQREDAYRCAEDWVSGQIADGSLHLLPVRREE